MRLDQAIAARFPHLSRRQARDLIAQRRVLVNERPVAIASRQVSDRDRIVVVDDLPPLDIIKTTDDFIAVAKPSGMPTQPVRDRKQRSLEELLRLRFKSIYLVHRLDTGTSGVVVFARTREAAATLSALFAGREMRKVYLARIDGRIDDQRTIDTPIDGKPALTIVAPRHDNLIEAEIRTGRTHQIRIHLASIGHPVLGDRRYGGPKASRLMLHAWKLEHDAMGRLEAPPPDDLIRSAAPWKAT